jgi:hypothetical protein
MGKKFIIEIMMLYLMKMIYEIRLGLFLKEE